MITARLRAKGSALRRWIFEGLRVERCQNITQSVIKATKPAHISISSGTDRYTRTIERADNKKIYSRKGHWTEADQNKIDAAENKPQQGNNKEKENLSCSEQTRRHGQHYYKSIQKEDMRLSREKSEGAAKRTPAEYLYNKREKNGYGDGEYYRMQIKPSAEAFAQRTLLRRKKLALFVVSALHGNTAFVQLIMGNEQSLRDIIH